MKQIKIPFTHRHINDVKRIQKVLLDNKYSISLKDAAGLWEEYSEMFAAGWLGLPDSDVRLFEYLKDEAGVMRFKQETDTNLTTTEILNNYFQKKEGWKKIDNYNGVTYTDGYLEVF